MKWPRATIGSLGLAPSLDQRSSGTRVRGSSGGVEAAACDSAPTGTDGAAGMWDWGSASGGIEAAAGGMISR